MSRGYFNLQEMNDRLETARMTYLREYNHNWYIDTIKFIDALKPLKPEHYDENGRVKSELPAGYVSPKLMKKMKTVNKHLKDALPHQRALIEAKNAKAALEKLEKKVYPISRIHKVVGKSKTLDYHESGRGGCYNILDGLSFGGLTELG